MLNVRWWWWFSCYLMSNFLDPMDCSLPGSSAHGISQARILEWVPFPTSGDLPDPGIKPASPVSPDMAYGFFTTVPPGKSTEWISRWKRIPAAWVCLETCLRRMPSLSGRVVGSLPPESYRGIILRIYCVALHPDCVPHSFVDFWFFLVLPLPLMPTEDKNN